jgi:hypothetical protein
MIEVSHELARFATQQAPSQAKAVDPHSIPLIIDDDGIGGSVTDQLVGQGYRACPVNARSRAIEALRYPSREVNFGSLLRIARRECST